MKKKNKIRQRLWKIRAKKVIIATGAIERPLIFNNNDRPGIILSSSIKKYIDFYGVKCGNKISLFTNNDSAYETAISLNKSGVNVNSIIDWDSLNIQIYACYSTPPEEIPEDYILLEVKDTLSAKKEYIYRGWMISSSPDVTPLEHPIYDLWIKDCKI